jgi:Type I phosphodiesterase / nucleotide pyrophosphatase
LDGRGSGPGRRVVRANTRVRWQEFLNGESGGKPIFEYLHSTIAQGAYIFGDDRVSNSQRVSLPAYQSIFAGAVQSCESNGCGRITAETFAERAARELKLRPTKVATIASWSVMTCAVESAPKSTFVNAGDVPLHDGIVDGEHAENNRLQEAAKWTSKNKRGFARLDEHTYRHALTYLRRHRPNFLFISLLDSDMYAHERNYTAYRKTLQRYDHRLKQLAETLDSMGEYGRKTALIVTTDHGRGAGQESWIEHGVNVPEASRIWTYVRLPKNGSYRIVDPSRSHSHIDIRPTVETLLGMEPLRCDGCGASFVEKST